MKIVISSGHGEHVAGASGIIDEVTEARKVVAQVVKYLRASGADVIEYHENNTTNKTDNLNTIIAYHNSQMRDLDVSVHFNSVAGGIRDAGIGVEVLYYSEAELAARVSKAIANASGLINRGAKQRTDLGFLARTNKPAILIELCFVVSKADVQHYQEHFDAICRSIAETVSGKKIIVPDAVAGTPIMSPPTATINQMKKWAEAKNAAAFFIGLADTFYCLSVISGVNPVVVYCQSAKETKYGNFGGVLNASYNNPCGMKTKDGGGDYDPSAHQRFSSWEDGIQAQIDHLALYAGAAGYPKSNTPDPRHFSFIAGKAPTVESLGGNWAPAESYGTDILRMVKEVEAVKAETKTETIRINITTPAENIDGHWMMRQADGKLVKVRDALVELGLSGIKWDETSRTITAGR